MRLAGEFKYKVAILERPNRWTYNSRYIFLVDDGGTRYQTLNVFGRQNAGLIQGASKYIIGVSEKMTIVVAPALAEGSASENISSHMGPMGMGRPPFRGPGMGMRPGMGIPPFIDQSAQQQQEQKEKAEEKANEAQGYYDPDKVEWDLYKNKKNKKKKLDDNKEKKKLDDDYDPFTPGRY